MLTDINHFRLPSSFCRNNDHDGSCIFVKKGIVTKELSPLYNLGGKKFELSLIELVQYGITVICIYRTPDGKFYIFLNKS